MVQEHAKIWKIKLTNIVSSSFLYQKIKKILLTSSKHANFLSKTYFHFLCSTVRSPKHNFRNQNVQLTAANMSKSTASSIHIKN